MKHEKTFNYGLGLGISVHKLMSLGAAISKSAISTFKQMPIIGWALEVIGEGANIVGIFQNKELSAGKKAYELSFAGFKLGLATTAALLPVFIAGAVMATAGGIAAIALATMGAYGGIKGAYAAWKKMKASASPADRQDFRVARADAVLSAAIPLALTALFFIPGGALVAIPALLAIVSTKLLLATYKLGLGDKQPATKLEAEVGSKARNVDALTPRPAFLNVYGSLSADAKDMAPQAPAYNKFKISQ